MKKHLLIFVILLASFSLLAQTPTITSLVIAGENIIWYSASLVVILLNPLTVLFDGIHDDTSQTINSTESAKGCMSYWKKQTKEKV